MVNVTPPLGSTLSLVPPAGCTVAIAPCSSQAGNITSSRYGSKRPNHFWTPGNTSSVFHLPPWGMTHSEWRVSKDEQMLHCITLNTSAILFYLYSIIFDYFQGYRSFTLTVHWRDFSVSLHISLTDTFTLSFSFRLIQWLGYSTLHTNPVLVTSSTCSDVT